MKLDPRMEKALDDLCRAITFHRDGFRCRRCGKERRLDGQRKQLQWAHIVTRRCKRLRWDLANVLTLCGGCHMWLDSNKDRLAKDWLVSELGLGHMQRLWLIHDSKVDYKLDYVAIRLYLMDLAKQMGILIPERVMNPVAPLRPLLPKRVRRIE